MNTTDLFNFIADKTAKITRESKRQNCILFSAMNNAKCLTELENLHDECHFEENQKFSGWIVFNSDWGWNWTSDLFPRPEIKENEELYEVQYNNGEYTIEEIKKDK